MVGSTHQGAGSMPVEMMLSDVVTEIRRQITTTPAPTVLPPSHQAWGWRAEEPLFRVTDRLPDPSGDTAQLQSRGCYVTVPESDTLSGDRDRDECAVHDQVVVTLTMHVVPTAQRVSELALYDLEDLLRRRLCSMAWHLGRDLHIRFIASRRARAQQSAEWLICTQTFQLTRYITLD